MYIFKNALRCISRSKGRNVLIGIIVFVIGVSACIGLSIREAAENAREETLSNMSVTGTISFDRKSAMSNFAPPESQGDPGSRPEFDRSEFSQMMGNSSDLTLEEYEKYSKAKSVKDFYYSLTVSVNGGENLEPVSSEEESNNSTKNPFGNMPSGMGGFGNRVMGAQSDFSLIGYSSESAMTSFFEGTTSITDGAVFEEATENLECIISEEVATYNSITVDDEIIIANPNNEEETYTFKVTGIYTDTTANENSFSMMGMTSNDPANKIYTSYNALTKIIDSSTSVSTTLTDENTGREYETKLSGNIDATYVFADVESYENFEAEARALGLDDSYTISSADISAFENSLTPLTTLSKTAGYFLAVILIIGAIILIVLNIFNVRERKYEIGVLTAMGMKKQKVALQFLTEIFIVTLAAVIIGAGIGAVTSVPVTNALLANQTASGEQRFEQIEEGFGRGPQMQMPDFKGGNMFENFGAEAQNYITEINTATNFTVILQMLGIALLLTLVGGCASMLFIMRYEPLKILSNRD